MTKSPAPFSPVGEKGRNTSNAEWQRVKETLHRESRSDNVCGQSPTAEKTEITTQSWLQHMTLLFPLVAQPEGQHVKHAESTRKYHNHQLLRDLDFQTLCSSLKSSQNIVDMTPWLHRPHCVRNN